MAHLARLEITDKEKEKFTAQLNDILLYIDKLNELDTKGVEPMSHAIAVTNAFREDKILDSIGTENSLGQCAGCAGEFFRVPKSNRLKTLRPAESVSIDGIKMLSDDLKVFMELHQLTIHELQEKIKNGNVSATQITQSVFSQN